MAGAGKLASLAENLIDAGSAVAGCGPAFVDLFIEALADGGVAFGPPPAPAPDCMPSKPAFYFLVCLFLLAASSVGRAQQLSYLSRPRRICQIRNS